MPPTESSTADDYLQQLYAMSLDMLSVAGTDGYFKHVNPAFERTLGYSTAELLAVPFIDFVHPEDVAATLVQIAKLSEGNQTTEFKNRYLCKDGTYKWLSWNATPDSKAELIYAVARDITLQKQIEGRLLRAHRLESLGTFTSTIAHDLNNILTPVLIAAEMLVELNPKACPKSQRLFEVLENNTRRGGELVERIIAFTIGSSKKPVPLRLKRKLRNMQKLITETFPSNVTCQTHIEPGLWTVMGDPSQFYQLLLNLTVNAKEAMPNGGSLSISLNNNYIDEKVVQANLAAHTGRYVSLTIADTGVGIPSHLQEKILDPFFTTKQDQRGSGLGLTTVLSILEEHDGFLTIESAAYQGSTFTAFFPVTADPEQSQSRTPPAQS